ncbi:MAG: ATP-dependent Clp protease ATP-binding subunit [bacterium]|nr:ATP-dependent Clp protease ATP-binding subunit [bacterium]
MEQFFPSKSRVFAAGSFANFYSSTALVAVRWVLTVVLIISLVILAGGHGRLFYFIASLSIFYFVFEIFYREKTLKEEPMPIKEGGIGNLADHFNLGAARFILQIGDRIILGNLFKALSKNKEVIFSLYRADISKRELDDIFSGADGEKVVEVTALFPAAFNWAKKENRAFVDKLDLFLAAVSQSPQLQKLLFAKEIKENDLLNIVFWTRIIYEQGEGRFWERGVESLGPGIGEFWMGGWTPETERYTLDITKNIRKGDLAAVLVGRNREINQVEKILSRGEKRNTIVLGPAGSGKTTIIYGLAEKSIRGELPQEIKYKRFLQLDVTALLAGAASGELENRIQNFLTELSHAGNVVLYIPDIETLAGSGSSANITGYLLNALSTSNLQVVATTTRESFRRYIEPQGSFAALFEVIDVQEPTREETTRILEEAAAKVEAKHKTIVTYKALSKVVELADRYIVDKVLPGKAIDLLDESAAAISLKQKPLLETTDVEAVVTEKTKIPVSSAKGQEAEKLINLEAFLHQRIIDQEEAIVAIANAMRRARTIQRETKKPIGGFLFLGPTGVGKTETAKALASQYFGGEESIIRIDMSEYQTETSINRLIGAPPGTGSYEEGGEFTEKVRQNPYSLILLDEMEKAHQKIQEAFLPVFDEGVLEDATARKIIFTNCIIIATSNAGAEFIREEIGKQTPLETIKKVLLEKLQREGTFKPEFLNRFDDVIVYKPLSGPEIMQVVSLMIVELADRLKKQDVTLTVDSQAIAWIARTGFDAAYGARPLRRFIADNIEEKIAEKILSGNLKRGSQIQVTLQNNQLVFN